MIIPDASYHNLASNLRGYYTIESLDWHPTVSADHCGYGASHGPVVAVVVFHNEATDEEYKNPVCALCADLRVGEVGALDRRDAAGCRA